MNTRESSDTSTRPASAGSVNRLSRQKSPYLLQHAANPVEWYPWGDEAFDRARADDRPVFLSIGYSTCHWCHVMARESFENGQVARLLNAAFVCIKVDREERPDVDAVYMAACQAMTGGGGWPLTLILTPDKVPVFAATYIPPESRYGRPGLKELIPRIQELWRTNRSALLDVGQRVVAAIAPMTGAATRNLDEATLEEGFRELSRRYDPRHAGFGSAPKFPTPHTLMLLLRHWRRTGNARALEMVEHTLSAMRRGGIYDHVGSGFHRYSTDERWLVPHFEKMLYDQAMLTMAYTEAYLATGAPTYAATARDIIDYVLRDLSLSVGAFASAEDADSEGGEGLFYLWTADEIRAALPADDARLAITVFGVQERGNFRPEAGGGATGCNVLHLPHPLADVARAGGLTPDELDARLTDLRARLQGVRSRRIRPHRDDKILADWNGLMIAALAKAAAALDEPTYADAARRGADFVLTAMRTPDGGLLHRYRDGEASIPAFADDYAFMAWGLLELYEATFASTYLQAAVELTDRLLVDFADEQGALFLTAGDAETTLIRPKEVYDGATPSANSVALGNLVRLGRMTEEARYEDHARRLATAWGAQVHRAPSAHAHFLIGLDHLINPSTEIVIAGAPHAEDTRALISVTRSGFLPATTVILNPLNPPDALLSRIIPSITDEMPVGGQATAYVCRDRVCHSPVSNAAELRRLLAHVDPHHAAFPVDSPPATQP